MKEQQSVVDNILVSSETRILLPFAAVGAVWLASQVISFLRLVLNVFVLPGKPLRDFGPPSSWALITGASDGIGLEFATQLAAQKFNVLLVSRTASKLNALSASLQEKYQIETKTLAMDFAHPTDQNWQELGQVIDSVSSSSSSSGGISILVNNVGLSHDIPVPFAETPSAEREAIIQINCAGTLKVTSLVLPHMLSQKRGLILTMGSFGGLLPTPLLATYSGSKAFLQQWSTALGGELASSGITVELVQSYLVASSMSKIRRTSLLVPSPRDFVKSTLAKIGREGGAQGFAHSCTPYWSHAFIQWGLGKVLGGSFTGGLAVEQNLAFHQDIRTRALRKREREAGRGKKTE